MKFWDKQTYSKGEQISDFVGVGFGGGWSWGAALSAKGHREIWGERDMFCFLIGLVVTQKNTFAETHPAKPSNKVK